MKNSECSIGGSAPTARANVDSQSPTVAALGAASASSTPSAPADGVIDGAARREILWKTLGRYDHYISTMNNKAAMVAAFDAAVLGATVLKVQEVLKTFDGSPRLHHVAALVIGTIALAAAMSLFFALKVIWPYLDSGKRASGKPSLIFFGDVTALTPLAFVSSIRAVTSEDVLEDLGCQVLAVASGLEKKTAFVRSSNWCVVVQLVALLFLGVLAICAVGW